MAGLESIVKASSEVFDKINNGENYSDVELKELAKKGKSAISVLIRMLYWIIIFSILIITVLIIVIINKPSKSENERLREDNKELRASNDDCQEFIQKMVIITNRQKQQTQEVVEDVQQKVDSVSGVVGAYNSTYNKIKKYEK